MPPTPPSADGQPKPTTPPLEELDLNDASIPESERETLELLVQMDSNFYKTASPVWSRNTVVNYPRIVDIWNTDGCRDLAKEPHGKGPALICGSGGSLNDLNGIIGRLHMPVFAGASNLGWFKHEGAVPHYCVIVDETPKLATWLDNFRSAEAESAMTVITHPCVDGGILSWPGDLLRMFLMFARKLPICHCLQDIYDRIAGLPGISSVVKGGSNCTIVAISIAHELGYGPIYLAGYDLACVDGFQRWDVKAPAPKGSEEVPAAGGGTCMTDPVFAAQEYVTKTLIDNLGADVRNLSRGLLADLPRATTEDLLADWGRGNA